MDERFRLKKSFGENLAEKVFDGIFPNKCLFCQKVLGDATDAACEKCTADLPKNVSDQYAAYEYTEAVRRAIFRFKYEGRRFLARPVAKLIYEAFGKIEGDFLMPVPLFLKREKERGFNQAAEIAINLGSLMKIPVYGGMERVRDTAAQFELNFGQRQTNVAEAFALKEGFDVRGKAILLVDDILTTGATAKECAEVLMAGGAKSVNLVVFAAANIRPAPKP